MPGNGYSQPSEATGPQLPLMFLGEDGSIYYPGSLTEREQKRGMLIPKAAVSAGAPISDEKQYAEIQAGLTNLVVRQGINPETL